MKKILFVLFAVFFIACEKEIVISKEDISHVAIIAHRGVTTMAPENGLRAIAQAADLGLDAVEFDIQFTKDKELILFHDDDIVNQTTGKRGWINEFTVQELKQLSLVDKLGVSTDEKIPTLPEVLDRVGTKIHCFIELKYSSHFMEKKLVEVLNEYRIDSTMVTVLSFDNNALVRLHSINESLPLCLLLYDDNLPPINNTFSQIDCSHLTAVGLHYSLCKKSTLEYLKKELNIKYIYVYTVNSMNKIPQDHFKWIDGIITDIPEEWMTFKFDY